MNIGDNVMMWSGQYALRHGMIEDIYPNDFEHGPFVTLRFFNIDGSPSKTRADLINAARFTNFGPNTEVKGKRRAKVKPAI